MITDFSTYTSAGLQNITYHGYNSLTTYGVLLAEGTETSTLNAKNVTDNIPGRDGSIDLSDLDGLKYESRTLKYRFKIFAETREELRTKESALKEWLNSTGNKQIVDSDYLETEESTINNVTTTTTTQWVFQNCNLKSIEIEEGDKAIECEYEYLTATFQADPYMIKQGTVNERVLKFTDNIAAGDSATIAVNNSTYTLTKSDGTTATGTLPSGDRKYRVTAYSEQVPTITLGEASVLPDAVFTLPASGTITISGAGQGYFELWHDTREVRL